MACLKGVNARMNKLQLTFKCDCCKSYFDDGDDIGFVCHDCDDEMSNNNYYRGRDDAIKLIMSIIEKKPLLSYLLDEILEKVEQEKKDNYA